MRFIHIADVHLGMTPDALKPWSEERKNEIIETFCKVLERCNEEAVDLLLIAGDLFHRAPLQKELKEINYFFSKLIQTKVVIIAGNHDYISERSHYRSFQWNENVIFLDKEQLECVYFKDIRTKVYGFSYHTRNVMEDKLDNLVLEDTKGIHILLAHGGEEKYHPMNMKRLSQMGFDYVALGHIHKPQQVMETIAYSGSLEPLDKNETGPHGYILGEIDESKQDLRLTFVPVASRQYYHLQYEIDGDMTLGQIKDGVSTEIRQLGREHIYKINLVGVHNGALEISYEDFSRLGNITEVVNESIPDYDYASLQYENRDNVIGMFIDAIRRSEEADEIADKALYYGIRALIGNDNEGKVGRNI